MHGEFDGVLVVKLWLMAPLWRGKENRVSDLAVVVVGGKGTGRSMDLW